MKKRVFRILAVTLCFVFCLQVFLGTGVLTLRVDAATMSVPSAVSNTTLSSENAFPHGNNLTHFTKVNEDEASNYASQMSSSGYTQTKKETLGNVTYWHYTHTNGGAAYLVYQNHANASWIDQLAGKVGELYVVTDDRSVTSAYIPRTSYTKVTDTTLGVMSLDYSYRTLADGNGMGFIWTLEDGSYLIMDGGYEHDSQRIYNYLVDNNKRPDGKVVIHAWYISHGHGDHYYAFTRFAADHANDVTLEYVIASAAVADEDPLDSNLTTNLAKFSGAKLVRPHTGETYQMPGLTMDILYTCEDLYVAGTALSPGNNESILSRITVGGQTVLFPGDGSDAACNKQVAMYGSELKSDFLQMNHHGISGATPAYFDNVKPSYVLWTSSQFATDLRAAGTTYQIGGSATLNAANKHLLETDLGNNMDRIFAGDGAVELITFPYDGNRDALPVYRMHDSVGASQPAPNGNVLYSQNFNNISAQSHTFADPGPTDPNTATTHKWQDLFGWDQMTPTDSVELEVTSDGRLRIYNPYYMTLELNDIGAGVTPNPEFVVEIGDFSQMVGNKVVLEYDFQYNARTYSTNGKAADAGAAAVFSFGKAVDRSRYCFAPALTLDGNYQARIGTKSGGSLLYSATTYSTGTKHVKIEIDPYNGLTTYVDGIAVSAVQNPAAWESIYGSTMGKILGLTVAPGVEVYLDNITLYTEDMEIPELIITEVGNAMGEYEYIEVYNNSQSDLDIYNYVLMRNTPLAATASSAKWTDDNIATIKRGTHTYTTASGQSVELTNPASGIIKPGETVILWIPSNTTRVEDNIDPTEETLEMFMDNYGLTAEDKIYAAYNNYNFSLWDSGNVAYCIGYANVDYSTHYTHALNEMVSYVYMNTTATNVYGSNETVTKHAQAFSSVEYQYNHNNGIKRGTFLKSTAGVHSCGTTLNEQERRMEIVIGGKTYEIPLSAYLPSLNEIDVNTLEGVSIRLNDPNGMRWITSVDAHDYAALKKWQSFGTLASIEIGTIIGRTNDLGSNALTLDLVDGAKFHKVLATDAAWFGETAEGDHLFAGSVANIKKENYTAKYAGVGYLKITFSDGSTQTIYGGYDADAHARSVAEVAHKALIDADHGLSAAELEIVASYAAYYVG